MTTNDVKPLSAENVEYAKAMLNIALLPFPVKAPMYADVFAWAKSAIATIEELQLKHQCLVDSQSELQTDYNDCNSERARWKDRAALAEAEVSRLRAHLKELVDIMTASGDELMAYERRALERARAALSPPGGTAE